MYGYCKLELNRLDKPHTESKRMHKKLAAWTLGTPFKQPERTNKSDSNLEDDIKMLPKPEGEDGKQD